MAEKLIIISDMWGSKKGLWITSYLGYLQQYYDIEYYDSQQLANIDVLVQSEAKINEAFLKGGLDRAAANLIARQKEACHYLAFSIGGSIAWRAALKGLPMKSMYVVSSSCLHHEVERPDVPITVLCGGRDENSLCNEWAKKMDVRLETMQKFGHNLYSDEVMIQKICLDLLKNITQIEIPKRKVV